MEHLRSRRSKDDATMLHGTARLPELHGRNSSLHRHPLFHNTYGEPLVLPLLTAGPCYSGDGAPYHERVS